MKRDKRAGAEAGVGPTGFSTGAMPAYSDGRGAPDGIRSVTNRSRASRNGAVVFAVVVFVLAFGIVLAAAQAAFVVNSFEFHRCRRTPQVEYLTLSLGRLLYIANSEYSSFTVWTTRVSNPV